MTKSQPVAEAAGFGVCEWDYFWLGQRRRKGGMMSLPKSARI